MKADRFLPLKSRDYHILMALSARTSTATGS